MGPKEEQELKEIIDMLAFFSKRLVTSGFCDFIDIQENSADKLAQIQGMSLKDSSILTIQYANSVVRCFYNGIYREPSDMVLNMGHEFNRESDRIRAKVMHFMNQYPVSINLELWMQEYIRSLSTVKNMISTFGKSKSIR